MEGEFINLLLIKTITNLMYDQSQVGTLFGSLVLQIPLKSLSTLKWSGSVE